MCDYSLHAVATRPAKVGETLITTTFRGTSTRGFASEREPAVAVCMLPGTELAFAEDVKYDNRWIWTRTTDWRVGKFNQIGHRITGDRRGQSNERGVGWEYVHVCIDDHSRIAFARVMPNEKKRSAIAFLKAALAYYASLGIKVERVMTDNGSCYKSFAFRRACKRLGLRHIRTKPYTPKTNGKAERFIQTSLREWAYAQAYKNSQQRKASYRPGCIDTTGIGHTPESMIKHPSADSA